MSLKGCYFDTSIGTISRFVFRPLLLKTRRNEFPRSSTGPIPDSWSLFGPGRRGDRGRPSSDRTYRGRNRTPSIAVRMSTSETKLLEILREFLSKYAYT